MPEQKEPYKIEPNNWFVAKPYGFAFYDRSSGASTPAKRVIWLPISPSNIQTTTPMATNVITTLYGIVEEHSEIRHYDIVISGTTGIAPKHIGFLNEKENKVNSSSASTISSGRSSFDLGSKVPVAAAFIDSITDLASVDKANESGVDPLQTGYYAFHKLYQFFLMYKEDTAGRKPDNTKEVTKRKRHPLTFLNYKDNIQYDCAPTTFSLVRSAENPMLYNYSIVLRAYNLKTITSDNAAEDIFKIAEDLGLFGGLSSGETDSDVFAEFSDAASAVGSFLGGL